MPEIRIGISGWRYGSWRGVFYPKGLCQADELAFAASRMSSLEINGSFYSLQRPEYYRAWYAATPPGFVFAVKGARYVTHMRKLREIEAPLANFFASGVLALAEKLGPILWQFPASFTADERFEPFFELLPRDTRAAAELARGHDARLSRRSFVPSDGRARALRYAVEIRQRRTLTPAFIELLRRHQIALVVADTAGRWPFTEDVTADFAYVRLHGDEELYASGYSAEALAHWAERVRIWSRGHEPKDARRVAPGLARRQGRDVYVYFDNDAKVHAPFDAMALLRKLGTLRDAVASAQHQ